MQGAGYDDVDCVITTRELAKMIRMAHIEFVELQDEKFDSPIGEATGAAAIFGVTGGVMEAALRTAKETLEGKELEKLEFEEVRGKARNKKSKLKYSRKRNKSCSSIRTKKCKTNSRRNKNRKSRL